MMPPSLQNAASILLAFGVNVVRLCAWLVLLSMVFVPLERLFALRRERILRKYFFTDLGYYFLNSLVTTVLLSLPLSLLVMLVHPLLPAAYTAAMASLPPWVRLMIALLIADIGFYWGHRWCHEIPLLWRFHAIHHSAEHIDFMVNTRAHPIDMIVTRLCGLVPLYLLGLAAPAGREGGAMAMLVVLVGTIWGFFIHANLRWRLGLLEQLVATPAFHHWHHTLADHTNRNYAALLPCLDRIFGTLYLPRKEWPVRYGVAVHMPTSLPRQLLHPLSQRG